MRRELGSITEVAEGVCRVWVSAGFDPTTGRRRRVSQTVRGSDREAEIAFARLLLAAGKMPASEITVRQFLVDMYLPHVTGRRRPRTVDGYRNKIERHVLTSGIADLALAQLNPYVLDAWIDGVKGGARTRRHVYRVLSAALNVAVRWRLVEVNHLKAVEIPPEPPRSRPDVLSGEEAAAYLAAFRGHPLEPLIVVALGAGLRRCELAGLRWSDIRFWTETPPDGAPIECGSVTVARGLHDHHGEVIEEEPKSKTSVRTVALPEWAVAILKPLRGLGPLVVVDGAPMRPWKITSEYGKVVDAARIRRIPLKNLRHSHACLLLEAGVDLYTVSRRLGHSTVSVTERFYVAPAAKADRDAAKALGGLCQFVPSANSCQLGDRH